MKEGNGEMKTDMFLSSQIEQSQWKQKYQFSNAARCIIDILTKSPEEAKAGESDKLQCIKVPVILLRFALFALDLECKSHLFSKIV